MNEPIINAEQPWPWLEAFPESAKQFFNGRDEDSEALFRCVLSAPVTVLFGKSGLGKSSLLQAGLFPRLRTERLLPIYIRLNHAKDVTSASEQIAKHLQEEIEKWQISWQATAQFVVENPPNETDSLWLTLHRIDYQLQDTLARRWQPVFVLDQFEEIFTLGAMEPERQKQTLYSLADLMENRLPKALAERLYEDDALYDRINLDRQQYRFMVSLREDYLPDLEEYTELISRLAANRYRLLPMSANQAMGAVEKTGGTLVTAQDAQNIVRYLSQSQEANVASSQRKRSQNQIEPALLSLICAGLNAERLKTKQAQLNTANLSKDGGLIVERFYDTAFDNMPESLRDFVEHYLITADGTRLPYPINSIVQEKLATAEQIKTLSDRRLIRRENLEEGDRIELVHDRLAHVALQRRRESQRRKALEKQRQRQRWYWLGAASLGLFLAVFAGLMFKAKTKAYDAWMEATAIRLTLEGGAMTSGLRPGGSVRGLLTVLAGHRLARSSHTDEALQTEALRFSEMVSLKDNPGAITSLAFVPGTDQLIAGSRDKTVYRWDLKASALIDPPLKGHSDAVLAVAVSPDGNHIASGSTDNTIRLWDTKTGQVLVPPLLGHKAAISSIAFSPDGKYLVSGSADNTLRLWDAKSGKSVGAALQGHEDSVASVAFSPDGRFIVSGSADKNIILWDVNTRQALRTLKGHEDRVSSVAFSQNGQRIASSSADKTLRIWDAITGQPIGKPLHGTSNSAILSIAFSPDGKQIASGSTDNKVRLWSLTSSKTINLTLTGHDGAILSVAFSPDGQHLVSSSSDNSVRLWEASTGHLIGEVLKGPGATAAWDINSEEAIRPPLTGHQNSVLSVAFSPDGSTIASASADNSLRLWQAKTGTPIGKPLLGHVGAVLSVAISPDGTRLVSGGDDKTIRLWDSKTGASLGQAFTGHQDAVTSVAFSPDNQSVISGSVDKTLRLWDIKTGRTLGQPFTGHEAKITSVSFSPDGSQIVSSSTDNTLRLWNAKTGQAIGQPLTGHEDSVLSVAFNPDGSRLVSGSYDNTLRLWDVQSQKSIGTPLKVHDAHISSVAFSPDGQRLVSGSNDHTLQLWEANTGQPIGPPLKGHTASVLSVAFSPDGSLIVSGSGDKTLRLWDVFEGWANALCKKLTRNMSQQEWRDWVSPDIPYMTQCPDLPIPPEVSETPNDQG